MSREVKLADGSVEILNDHFEKLVDADTRLSDNDGLFMQRQLEFIEAQSYDVLYPDLEARECFQTNTLGGAGVTTLTFRSYDRIGKAQVINARATDLPKSDISGKEFSVSVKSVGTSYDFDIDEIAAAQMAGMPLEARKAMASRRGYEEFINQAVWYGDSEGQFTGFFQNPEIAKNPVAGAAAGGATEWEKKTPDEVLFDLNEACGAMYAGTKKVHAPAELWLPVKKWNYIRSTPRSPNSDKTILQYFLDNNQFIKDQSQVKALNALEGQGTGGKECFVIINQKTPEGTNTVHIREPLPLQYMPVQIHGLVYEVPGRGRFGGLQVIYPRAMDIWYGI